jgi:hypothetical protein
MISADHLAMLASSGITEEFAIARGYETITDKHRLTALAIHTGETVKIVGPGRRVPGLLIPLLGLDGEVRSYQYRPDNPRLDNDGRPIKYESVWQQPPVLDVPPGGGPLLADPDVPLWITEGSKKADAAALAGLCCVSLSGVWCFMAKNKAGASMSLPEFGLIPWKGDKGRRRVIIGFDGDVARNKSVQKAMHALAGQLAYKGARVEYLWLPDTDAKTGLDDYLADHTVEELWALVKPTKPPPRTGKEGKGGFDPYPSNSTATPQQPWSGVVPGVAQLRDILAGVGKEVCSRGLVGEEKLAKTIYLVLTSRLLDKQVSAAVKGHSSSGKSYTVETVTGFFPPEAFLQFTAMSEKALVYSPEQYAHRTIVIYEVTAMREGVEDDLTSYLIRSLLSEGRIVYDVTVRDNNGGFTTNKITKEGPTNLIFTTTKTRVHAENETRVLSLATDDSTEQTHRVLLEIADEDNGGNSLDEWVDLQRWLASDHAEHRVTIPYAKELAGLVPPVAVRLRRDFIAVLALIRAHAMLHQLSRSRDDRGRIIATVEDYRVVRELVADVITEGVECTVSNTVRETVAAVVELTGGLRGKGTSAQAVATHLKIDKSNAGRRLQVAADGGYIENLEPRRGMAAQWVKGAELPNPTAVLPDAAQLRNTVAPVDLDCCGVAPESGRYGDKPPPPPSEAGPCDDGQPDPGDVTATNGAGGEAQALHLVTDLLGATPTRATDARTTAYINGRCIDCCTEPHSPGRPRCDNCHSAWLTAIDGHQR